MRGKRSNVDFSKHIITETENETTYICRFADPEDSCYAINFINVRGIMAVTGDCGNWIFCRGFRPSKDGSVSDGYWVEKLKISSTQKPLDFDIEGTKKEIHEQLAEEDLDEEDKEYLKDILSDVDEGEFWYLAKAHDKLPSGRDHEFVPHRECLNPMLAVVFDAFDEICRKMGE
jgi:hypothetical protein